MCVPCARGGIPARTGPTTCHPHSPTRRSPFLPSMARQKPAALTSSSSQFAGSHVQYGLEPSRGWFVFHNHVQLSARQTQPRRRRRRHPFAQRNNRSARSRRSKQQPGEQVTVVFFGCSSSKRAHGSPHDAQNIQVTSPRYFSPPLLCYGSYRHAAHTRYVKHTTSMGPTGRSLCPNGLPSFPALSA